jgi:hypothetical protein
LTRFGTRHRDAAIARAPLRDHVLPYSIGGTNEAIKDILGGRVHAVIESRPGLKGALDSGDLKALAIMSSERQRFRQLCEGLLSCQRDNHHASS